MNINPLLTSELIDKSNLNRRRYASTTKPLALRRYPATTLEHYKTALDNIYNHNTAAREAVIQHFGLHHHKHPTTSASQIEIDRDQKL